MWEIGEDDDSNMQWSKTSLLTAPFGIVLILEPLLCFKYPNKQGDYSKQQLGDNIRNIKRNKTTNHISSELYKSNKGQMGEKKVVETTFHIFGTGK